MSSFIRRNRMKRNLKVAGIFLSALAGITGATYYYFFRRPLPVKSGSLRLAGLQEEVEILRDPWGVPHIYAQNTADLFFAQGFVHAQDRLWQMDFSRRLVAGRVAEIIGKQAVDLDRWVRTLSMRFTAEQEVSLLDHPTRQILTAYAAGINARITQGKFPLEFNLLRYRPEPWTIVDSLSWAKMMAWNLSVNWEAEILRAQLISKLGPELAAELEPDYCSDFPYIIPPGVDYSLYRQLSVRRWKQQSHSRSRSRTGLGSNNWVISGEHNNRKATPGK
jgi:penicillin amidase